VAERLLHPITPIDPRKRKCTMERDSITSEDLLELGYENDQFLLEDPSLCSLCSWTSSVDEPAS
jgi:hypothetical protein